MPSPKRSWSKRSAGFFLAALLLASPLLFDGCIAVDETQADLDLPTGPDYLPVVTREPGVWPARVLILPVSGEVRDETRAEFERQFVAELRERLAWEIFLYPADSTTPGLQVSEDQARAKAREIHADAILQVDLNSEVIYAPLRVVAEVRMETVADPHAFYRLRADYDARNKTVANSARRYYQKQIQTPAPDKSLMILRDRPEFLRFCGWYTAKIVANSFVVASRQTMRAQTVTTQQSSVPPPHQDFQDVPVQVGRDK